MSIRRRHFIGLVAAILSAGQVAAETVPVGNLSHIHGLAVDAADPGRLYVATHHGLYVATRDGMATRISVERHDFMGFTPHPTDPKVLFGSGHPEPGGNLGFIVSTDGGKVWRQVSPGPGGPVDFHLMAVARGDPSTIYGVHGGLHRSRDGGRTWVTVGAGPERAIAIAVDALNAERLYAATEGGLAESADGGKNWRPAHPVRRAVSMVAVAPDGAVYAYFVGLGLIRRGPAETQWATLAALPGERVMLHLAAGPDRLYAATPRGEIFDSADGGRSWARFGAR